MFNLKQDDIISKTDMLLFDILEELKKQNKPLRPVAMDTEVKKKPKIKAKTKPKPKLINLVKTETLEVQNASNTDN